MSAWRNRAFWWALAHLFVSVPWAQGQTPSYRIERVASGLNQPVFVDQAPGDPANVIYYMTRVTTGGANAGSGTHGSLWRYDMETRSATEVLNLSHRNLTLDLGPQGVAFHPDFNEPGAPGYQKIYVSSAATGGPLNFVEEYVLNGPGGVAPIDGVTGRPLVNRLVMQYANVFGDNNHVIDWIGFDPRAYSAPVGAPDRNYLYISVGDGSNGRPASDRPEQKPSILQGKLLRIDVDPAQPDFYPADPLRNYAIPDTNPIPLWNATHGPSEQLVGTTLAYSSPTESISYAPALPEIYFTGTRNAFRMSLDRATGDFYAGDVGELSREEINFLPADPYDGTQLPYDFGFPQREGTAVGPFRSAGSTTIEWNLSGGGSLVAESVNPIREGAHATLNAGSTAGDVEIRSTPRSAYIGGYMYRGPVEELQGKYFYADFVQGNVFALDFDPTTPVDAFSGSNFNQATEQPGIAVASLGTREVVLNRNLNSLWHTLLVDPQDPTYTPELGASFGIGRVVSFGEDNAGNLYLVDMGGVRGNPGFGNDYPAGATGQIFRITPLLPELDIRLTINRETGELTLQNLSDADVDFTGYVLTSNRGALEPAAMIPVTGHYDAPIPPGDGSIDANDSWQIVVSSHAEFAEATTGDAGSLAPGTTIALGGAGAWIQSVYEDLSLQLKLADGATALGAVAFVGNDGQPFRRSDLNFNGLIDAADWLVFRGNYFREFAGMSAAEAYQFGDLDHDGDSDFADFRLFQSDFVAANGWAAFQALGQLVPEPNCFVLALATFAWLPRCYRRRGRREGGASVDSLRPRRTTLLVAAALTLWGRAMGPPAAQAALTHKYTFNQGLEDAVGGADGTLFGNATLVGGELLLPGGAGDYVALDAAAIGIAGYTDLTIEAWFTVDAHQTWQRLFDFGDRDGPASSQGYVYYAPQGGGGGGLGVYATFGQRTEATHSLPAAGVQHHLALVIDDNANGGLDRLTVYLNGALVTSAGHNKSLGNVLETYAFLGKSLVSVDPYFRGSLDEFRIYDHAFAIADVRASHLQGPTRLTRLIVNTVTGEARIETDSQQPLAVDYYEVRSPASALDVSTWASLADQGFDPDGPNLGQRWEEAELSDASRLAEFYLLGASELAAGSPLDLGRPFDPTKFGRGAPGDLRFQIGLQGGGLTLGGVEYVTPATFADFNVDGWADGRDLLAWQREHGKQAGATLIDGDGDFDGDVDDADRSLWEAAFGTASFGGAQRAATSRAVPEPIAGVIFVASSAVGLAMRRRRADGT